MQFVGSETYDRRLILPAGVLLLGETWLTRVREQGKKRVMNIEQRKEVGKILNEIKTHKLKRKESTTGKIYFGGIKDDRKKLNRELKRKARITR